MDPLTLQHWMLFLNKAYHKFPLRKWDSLFDRRRLEMPKMRAKTVLGRIETNLQFFLANYIVLGLAALLYGVVMYPMSLIVLFLVVVFWMWLVVGRERGADAGLDLPGGSGRIEAFPLFVGGTLLSAVLLAYSLGLPVAIWLIFVLVHTVVRKRSVKASASLFVDKVRGSDIASNVAQGVDRFVDSSETVAIDLSTPSGPSASTHVREQYQANTAAVRAKYSGAKSH